MSDRKYKHRGYQDGGGHEERKPAERQQPRPRPGPEQGPRGRGLGAPTDTVFRCRVCGARQHLTASLPCDAICDSCRNDLHTCSNCVFFDTSRPNECRKPVLARVANKTKRNTCELFAPNTVQEFAQDRSSASDPRAAFDALFKKK